MLIVLTAGLTTGWADVIQTNVLLPPALGAYSLEGICVSALNRCTEDVTVSGFNITTTTEQSGNELVTVDANYSAGVFTDNGGLPGLFIGQLVLSGTVNFTFVGRDPGIDPLGTFTTELTAFDFTGILNGQSFEVKQNPGSASIGSTTILEATFVPPIEYNVSSSLEVFGEYSVNGSPFTAAPGQTTTLTTVPEPISGLLEGSMMIVALWTLSRRSRVSRS